MSEKEVFIRLCEMMGWDSSIDDKGTFVCVEVKLRFEGWRLRSNLQETIEHKKAMDSLTSIRGVMAKGEMK